MKPGELIKDFSATIKIHNPNQIRNLSFSTSYQQDFSHSITEETLADYHQISLKLSPTDQAALGQKGFNGMLMLDLGFVKEDQQSYIETLDDKFIHTLGIQEHAKPFPISLTLYVPALIGKPMRLFIQKLVTQLMESVQPWGQVNIVPFRNAAQILGVVKKAGYISAAISIQNMRQKENSASITIQREEQKDVVLNLNSFAADLQDVIDATAISLKELKVSLKNVTVSYASDQVDTVTQHHFSQLFAGIPVYIAGKLKDQQLVNISVSGYTEQGYFTEQLKLPVRDAQSDSFHQLWTLIQHQDLLKDNSNRIDKLEAMPELLRYLSPFTLLQTTNYYGDIKNFRHRDLVKLNVDGPECQTERKVVRTPRQGAQDQCTIILELGPNNEITIEDSNPHIPQINSADLAASKVMFTGISRS